MATKYKVFVGNSRKVGSNTSLPHIGMTGTHSASVPAPSVKAYLDALAAVKSNTALAANAATAQQTAQPAAGGGGGSAAAPAPAAGSGDPILDGLNGQLQQVQGQLVTDTNTQNAQAQAARDRIAQGNAALQGQIGQLGATQAQGNAAAGSSINNVYAQAQQAAAAQAAASQGDLAAQGFATAPLQAQAAQRSQDLTDQAARQSALQQRLAQISGNDFTSKQANAQEYTTGAGAQLEAALAKNLGVLGTNSAKTQQDLKDAIAQYQSDLVASGGSSGRGGGGGGGRKGGSGGGAGGSGPGGALVPGDPGYQNAPGDLGDAKSWAAAADAENANNARLSLAETFTKLTGNVDPKSKYGKYVKSIQTQLLAGAPLTSVASAWEKTKAKNASLRQQATATKDSPTGPKGNANAKAGFKLSRADNLLNKLSLAQQKYILAQAKKPGASDLVVATDQVKSGTSLGSSRKRAKAK